MSWAGIFLVPLRRGETAEVAVRRTTEGWIEQRDGGVVMVGNREVEETPPTAKTDRWINRVVARLKAENKRFKKTEEHFDDNGHREWVVLDDEEGPVAITVYAGEVQIKPVRDCVVSKRGSAAAFKTMWRYCQLLAAAEHCIAHDPDYDELVDLSLTADKARRRYNWI